MEENMREIAVIRIYRGDKDAVSNSHRIRDSEWAITLNPKADKDFVPKVPDGIKVDEASILAHELGHVVSAIVGTQPLKDPFLQMMGLPDPNEIAEEKRAWKLAEIINPKVSRTLRDFAISTYTQKK